MFSRFVIVTGMSGAGKSTVLKVLEDIGYFCADNMPVSLLVPFAKLGATGHDSKMKNIAVGIDIRSGESLGEVKDALSELTKEELPFEILFMDCDDDILVKRYKETRRIHPLAGMSGLVEEGIKEERKAISFFKENADQIIDTGDMLVKQLTRTIRKSYAEKDKNEQMPVTFMSFGYKYGLPQDADIICDVRFLPNPYYVETLKKLSGNDAPVSGFVLGFDLAKSFVEKTIEMIKTVTPAYFEEGKNILVIGIGCTGGRHRSVAIANELGRLLSLDNDYAVSVEHRDLPKDPIIKGK